MDSEISLVLSETQMSGFRYAMDRKWTLGVSRKEIVTTMREAIIDLAKKYDIYLLSDIS
jgi:hypothetical protein